MKYFLTDKRIKKEESSVKYQNVDSTAKELMDPNTISNLTSENNPSLKVLNNVDQVHQLMNFNFFKNNNERNKNVVEATGEDSSRSPTISRASRSALSVISKVSRKSSNLISHESKLDSNAIRKKSEKVILINNNYEKRINQQNKISAMQLERFYTLKGSDKELANNLVKENPNDKSDNAIEEMPYVDSIPSSLRKGETRKKIKRVMSVHLEQTQVPTRRKESLMNTYAISKMLKRSETNTDYGNTLISLKWIDLLITVILSINICLSIIDNAISLGFSDDYLAGKIKDKNKNNEIVTLEDLKLIETRELFPVENFLRSCNVILSVSAAALLIFKYKKRLELLKFDGKRSKYDNLWSSGYMRKMMVDVIISLIFYPPGLNKVITSNTLGYNYVYNWNSIFSVLVMAKLYLIFRVLKYLSRWNSETAVAVCKNFKVESGVEFTIKAEMKKRPVTVLTLLLFLALCLLAFSIQTFEYKIYDSVNPVKEKNGFNDLENLADCFWLVIITMFTVGYGDFYLRTGFGRIVGIIAGITGMLLLSLIVVSMSSISEFTPEETKAFSKLKKLFADDNMENKAANVVRSIIMLKMLVEENSIVHKENYLMDKFFHITNLKKEISIFKNDYRIANSLSMPVDEMLQKLDIKLKNDINKLTSTLGQINEIDVELDNLAKDQEEAQSSLQEIINMQNDIAKYLINLNNEHYLKHISSKSVIFPEKFKSDMSENHRNYNRAHSLKRNKQNSSALFHFKSKKGDSYKENIKKSFNKLSQASSNTSPEITKPLHTIRNTPSFLHWNKTGSFLSSNRSFPKEAEIPLDEKVNSLFNSENTKKQYNTAIKYSTKIVIKEKDEE